MKKAHRLIPLSLAWIIGFGLFLSSCHKHDITLESLLTDMISPETVTRFPEPYFVCLQESSHDRASVSPDQPGWFANNDGFGCIRTDTMGGCIEKVMFDDNGPGVITRIWITTLDTRGTWRFYFDGEQTPRWIIPAYDLLKANLPGVGKGLIQAHTSYSPEGKGGNTSFLPIPYGKSCKITFEDEKGVQPTPKYYQINYRKYPPETKIETFSLKSVSKASKLIAEVNQKLLHPTFHETGTPLQTEAELLPGDSLLLSLPKGEQCINSIEFNIQLPDSNAYAQCMRQLLFTASFDKKQTVWAPLSDFSGGGMGAPAVESWFLSSDGKGHIISRWPMPYREEGELMLKNLSENSAKISLCARTIPAKWDEQSLYFHASWRQQKHIYIHNNPEEEDRCVTWNFASIKGKGLYMGDVLSLFNHAPRWYGEGDEKIWVDEERFPSHFGTGTEDYYNSSWAPVVPFHTPFGGAPRADLNSSHGYNTFFRTRILDGIPFKKSLQFDIEMLGWDKGYADYSTTIYWYGDYDSQAYNTSGLNELREKLLPAPEDPAKYKIADAIEFETLTPTSKSTGLQIREQDMTEYIKHRWSKAKHLLCFDGKPGDFIEFSFGDLGETSRQIILYNTMANDYATLDFYINGRLVKKNWDGYHHDVRPASPIRLGTFTPKDGKIQLKIVWKGANSKAIGAKYLAGLDCIRLIPTTKTTD